MALQDAKMRDLYDLKVFVVGIRGPSSHVLSPELRLGCDAGTAHQARRSGTRPRCQWNSGPGELRASGMCRLTPPVSALCEEQL